MPRPPPPLREGDKRGREREKFAGERETLLLFISSSRGVEFDGAGHATSCTPLCATTLIFLIQRLTSSRELTRVEDFVSSLINEDISRIFCIGNMNFGRLLCSLISLAVALMISSSTGADAPREDKRDTMSLEETGAREKISTLLKVEDSRNNTEKIRDLVTSAMKFSDKRQQIGQVLPIIRTMSPSQKLALATLVSSRLSTNESLPYDEVHSLLGHHSRINATRELMLPISMDIAKILAEEETSQDSPEELPEAQELKLLMRPARNRRPYYHPRSPPARPPSVNRRNVFPVEGSRVSSKRPSRRPSQTSKKGPSSEDCTFFTKTVCLKATDYPHEAIARSIRGNREMVAALLTDYKSEDDSDKDDDLPTALALENHYENRYESNEIKRRADYASHYENVEEGFTCPSTVVYARPQLARAVSGMWKYIINTGEHTQTLRLEKCSNPKTSCSFISENYRSSCTQVYNYHRLLTWESSLGLHMDIFKVPTCCSCHVHGYVDLFPPVQKDPRPSHQESFPGAEFATDDQDSDPGQYSERPTSYLTKFKPSSLDTNFLSSSKKPSVVDAGTANRPSFALPGRRKKPPSASASRPFDKLPQQHAPNTRAPGYKGPIVKSNKRPVRPSRPYRRESSADLGDPASSSSVDSGPTTNNWSSQIYEEPEEEEQQQRHRDHHRQTEASRGEDLRNGGFDDEYQEPNRRVNYNYHPIIDFFKPEASLLQASSEALSQSSQQSSNASWKPLVSA